MIGWVVKFILGKASGPILIYILLGLVAANATTGYLLKNAWQKNARAVLQCENAALRDANEANEKTSQALLKSQREFAEYRTQVREATALIERENADARRAMEIDHEQTLADLEVATNEIPDDDFFCATEPVSVDVLAGMRDAATAYNENRGGHDP